MKIRCLLTTLLFLTTSCTQGNTMISGQNSGIWKDADGKTFEIQRNPNPKEAYDFTVTLIDAPKELQATMAGAFYVSDCQLTVNKAAGANTLMNYMLPIHLNKIKDNIYQATVYKDALQENFPNGTTCKWRLSLVSISFEPIPNIAKIVYSSFISVDPIDKDFTLVFNENHFRLDTYITKYQFNEAGKYYTDGKMYKSSALLHKGFFGEKQRKELVTIRLEMEKK